MKSKPGVENKSKHGTQHKYLKKQKYGSSIPTETQSNLKQTFKRNKSALTLALEKYNSNKAENHKKKEELNQRMEEKKKALEMYKKKKSQKLKRMSKKTKKGQPIMKYWMESLLEKIQNS